MDEIAALITFSDIFLANRLIIIYFSIIPLIIFDLILSFMSVVFSLNSSSSSFSCSLPRFLAQPSVLLGESSEPRVFSLVSPI